MEEKVAQHITFLSKIREYAEELAHHKGG